MFEKLQTGEKIHDAPRQPQTCSHLIYARTLTGVCQAIRIFSPCFFSCIYIHLLLYVGRGLLCVPTAHGDWIVDNKDVSIVTCGTRISVSSQFVNTLVTIRVLWPGYVTVLIFHHCATVGVLSTIGALSLATTGQTA